MATPARLAGVGVFVVAGICLFTVALFMIGDRQMAFAKKFTVFTEFKKITGLQPGGIVRVSGAKAGTIKAIGAPSAPVSVHATRATRQKREIAAAPKAAST